MGCQTAITEKIIEEKGYYVIALKANQKSSYDFAKDIISNFVHRERRNIVTRYYTSNDGHGRHEERECIAVSYGNVMGKMFKDKFAGLKSIVGIISRRTIISTGETTEETRYYVTPLSNKEPEIIANAIRQHWSIENNLNWQLDFTFREDDWFPEGQ